MKWILIGLLILTIAIFTGTWIFGGLAWIFNIAAKFFEILQKAFNLFGWNDGLLLAKPLAISTLAIIGV